MNRDRIYLGIVTAMIIMVIIYASYGLLNGGKEAAESPRLKAVRLARRDGTDCSIPRAVLNLCKKKQQEN